MNNNFYASPVPPVSPPKARRSLVKKILHFFKRFWYLFLILLVALGALIAWRITLANNDLAWERASDYFAKADYEAAAAILERQSIPNDQAHLQIYAQTMLATSNLEQSLIAYQKLYDLTQDQPTRLIMGNIYNQQQNYDKAIEIYKDIISVNSSNTQAYINLTTVYRLQNQPEEALNIARQAVTNNPKNVILLEQKVSLLAEDKSSEEYVQSVAALKAINPNDPLLESLNEQ